MEQSENQRMIKEKYRDILALQFKDRFYQLEFLVNDILDAINSMMKDEIDKERVDYLFMKYSALMHTKHKEVSQVNNSKLSRNILLLKLKVAVDQIGLDLLGLV